MNDANTKALSKKSIIWKELPDSLHQLGRWKVAELGGINAEVVRCPTQNLTK